MSQPTEPDLPRHEPEEVSSYSLEIAARLAGVNTETILVACGLVVVYLAVQMVQLERTSP